MNAACFYCLSEEIPSTTYTVSFFTTEHAPTTHRHTVLQLSVKEISPSRSIFLYVCNQLGLLSSLLSITHFFATLINLNAFIAFKSYKVEPSVIKSPYNIKSCVASPERIVCIVSPYQLLS